MIGKSFLGMGQQQPLGGMGQMGQPQQPPMNLGAFNPMQTQTQMGQMAQMGQPQQPPMNLGAFNPMGQQAAQMAQIPAYFNTFADQARQQQLGSIGLQPVGSLQPFNSARQAFTQQFNQMSPEAQLAFQNASPEGQNQQIKQFTMDQRQQQAGQVGQMGQPQQPAGLTPSMIQQIQNMMQQLNAAPQVNTPPQQQPGMGGMGQGLGNIQRVLERLRGPSGGPPQAPNASPTRPEDARMQAMRGIQQLANRQRGFPFG